MHDRQLLAAEAMHEYNVRLVYPRLFAPKADEAVGEDDEVDWFAGERRRREYRAGEADSHAQDDSDMLAPGAWATEDLSESGSDAFHLRKRAGAIPGMSSVHSYGSDDPTTPSMRRKPNRSANMFQRRTPR